MFSVILFAIFTDMTVLPTVETFDGVIGKKYAVIDVGVGDIDVVWYCNAHINQNMNLPSEGHYMREFLVLYA